MTNTNQTSEPLRDAILARATIILMAELDGPAMLEQLAFQLVPSYADCAVFVILPGAYQYEQIALAYCNPDALDQMRTIWQREMPHLANNHPISHVLECGQPFFASEVNAELQQQLAIGIEGAGSQLCFASALVVPLLVRGIMLGALFLATTESSNRRFGQEDVDFAQELAHRVALVVDNTHLNQIARRRLAELTTVQQVAYTISSTVDLDAVFQTVVAQISSSFGYQMVSIYLREADGLVLKAYTGYETVMPLIRLDQGVTGRSVRSGKGFFVRDAAQDPDFIMVAPGTTQMIVVPFNDSSGQVLGTLLVESTGTPYLTEDDFVLLSLLSYQVSVAVTNARLYSDLRAVNEFLSSLLTHAPVPIYVYSTDPEMRLRLANPACAAQFGRNERDLIGRPLLEFIQGHFGQQFLDSSRRLIATGAAETIEETLETVAGTACYQTSKFPLFGPDGRVKAIGGISIDITERKRAEEERLAFERKLLEVQKVESLHEMAGGIAHEFNNLLTVITGSVELLRHDLTTGTQPQEPLTRIDAAVQRAGVLTRQMLAFSGRGQFVIQPTDLHSVVRETSSLYRASIPRTITLREVFTNDRPLVAMDVQQIQQLLLNLIINAAEAIGTEPGTIIIRTSVRTIDQAFLAQTYLAPDLPEGLYAVLQIEDSGCGMDAPTQARMFEPFFSTKFAGRGLGLPAVLGIVRGHRGALRVQSRLGIGTTMTILLPAITGIAQRPAPSQHSVPSSPPLFAPPDGKLVLVVDDEDGVRMVVTRILEQMGFSVLTANDGLAGIEVFQLHRDQINGMFLDLTMPRMGGIAVFRTVHQERPDLPVVLMSGYSVGEAIGQIDGLALAGFLQKPFSPNDLRTLARQILCIAK